MGASLITAFFVPLFTGNDHFMLCLSDVLICKTHVLHEYKLLQRDRVLWDGTGGMGVEGSNAAHVAQYIALSRHSWRRKGDNI